MLPMTSLEYTSLIKGQIVNESHGRYIKILRDLDTETKKVRNSSIGRDKSWEFSNIREGLIFTLMYLLDFWVRKIKNAETNIT